MKKTNTQICCLQDTHRQNYPQVKTERMENDISREQKLKVSRNRYSHVLSDFKPKLEDNEAHYLQGNSPRRGYDDDKYLCHKHRYTYLS